MIATLLLAPGIAQALGPTPATSPTPLTSPTPGSALAQSAVVAIPASWHAETITTKAEVVRRLGKWTNGPDAGESITLDVAPNFGLDLAAIAKATSGNMRNADPKASMLTSGPIRRCQGRPGWKQTFSDAGDGITVVYALTQSRAYFAIYKYPGYPGPSAEGEAAAESLCPPSDPIVHLPPPPISAPAGWRSKDTSAYDTSPGPTAWAWDPPLGQPAAEMLFVSEFPMPHATPASRTASRRSLPGTLRAMRQWYNVPRCNFATPPTGCT